MPVVAAVVVIRFISVTAVLVSSSLIDSMQDAGGGRLHSFQ